jgi:Outer membrane lipoprotein-sorting protein
LRKVASNLSIWLTGILFCTPVGAQPTQTSPTPQAAPAPTLASIVERMEAAQSQTKAAVPYQVTRDYRLFGEKDVNPSSEVVAEVDYLPPNHKSYVIQKRTGSSRGEDVVRHILQHESQMGAGGKSLPGAAIDRNNYSFTYVGEATVEGFPCYVLGLNPKRKETELVRGSAWVDQHTFLIRHIEGVMAKNPSWMLKKVDVKLDFADLGGAWLQTAMQAVADVHFVGTQTLESRTLNARVGDVVAQKQPGNVNRKVSRGGMPAMVMVPLERRP